MFFITQSTVYSEDKYSLPKRKRPVISDSSDEEEHVSVEDNASNDSVYETGTNSVSSVSNTNELKEGYTLVPLPSAVKKIKQEEMSLPDPFPFPRNYRPDVEICLARKRMTTATRANFYTSVARAMYQYKKSPSHDEYATVARQIAVKYPFLAAEGIGTSYVSFFD